MVLPTDVDALVVATTFILMLRPRLHSGPAKLGKGPQNCLTAVLLIADIRVESIIDRMTKKIWMDVIVTIKFKGHFQGRQGKMPLSQIYLSK